MFTALRATTLLGLLAAGIPSLLSAQSTTSVALPSGESGPKATRNRAPASQDAAGPHQPILDAQHRPITAGGFVKTGPIVFEDISEKAGLTHWTHKMGTPDKNYIIETKGSGVGLIDYDNDGWLDIYLVNGSTFDALTGKATPPHAALFHNNHDGTFTDVAAKAGVTNDRWGIGVAIADYDNDGWPDIFVSNFGKNRLYHNNHDGTFTDVAEKAGVTLGNWSTGATWGDYDGDGRLDLFVAGYVHWDWNNLPDSKGDGSNQRLLHLPRRDRRLRSARPQGRARPPLPQQRRRHLYRRQREGRRGRQARLLRPRRGLCRRQQRRQSRPCSSATTRRPNYLYINKGDGTFEDVSYASGFALNEAGRETASMGIAVGDYQNNGLLDIFNTTFSDDYKPFYRNEGDGNFTDISYQLGIAEVSVPFLSWGDAFIDYDNDGWKDLLMADGHVYPEADKYNWGTSWAERPMLFHNLEGKKFEAVPAVEGTGLADVIAGRGMAVGDLFNDGKIDVVINVMDGHPVLLRNVNPDHNHWLELKLVAGPKSPRDAVGATVYVTANGMKQRGDVISGGSYLSSNDPRPHFGLGQATTVDDIEIHWPSGKVEHFTVPGIDRIVTLTEGTGK